MRILFLDRFLGGHDGIGIYLFDITSQLLEMGHEVGLVYGKRVGDYYPVGLSLFEIEDFHVDWFGRSATRQALHRILSVFRPDIASAQCLDVYWFAELLSKRCPVMVNLLTHGATCPNWFRFYGKSRQVCEIDFGPACILHNYRDQCGPKNPKLLAENMLRVAANRSVLHHVDAVQALTPYMRGTLLRAGVPEHKLVDITMYAPFFDENRAYDPPKPRERPLILFVGRLHSTKGADLALEACSRLNVPFDLAFVGAGPLAQQLQERADALGLGERCQFYVTDIESRNAETGSRRRLISRDEMSQLFFDCTVVLFLSIWGEPSGIVRLEAMSHGRPLIGFDAGGTAHCIEEGVTGFVVPPLDIDAVSERLTRLIADPDLAVRMGRAALEHIKTHYHPRMLTEQMVNVYERLLAERRERAHHRDHTHASSL